MGDVQQEAVRAVSNAISSADVGLLQAIDSAQEKWQQELSTAKESATSMLANVLSQRESLRCSLSTAARLWHVLKPNTATTTEESIVATSPTKTKSTAQSSSAAHFLATPEQMTMVKALQNVSHTIFLMEFILAAPEALRRAHEYLINIQDSGLFDVHTGNAASLVDAHAILTAVERLRDVVLLEAPQTLCVDSASSHCFANAAATRNLLEDIVIRGVFANAVPISQTNPRLLVAAARVVQAEETEDTWWASHVQRCAGPHLAAQVRPYGALRYKQRALDAVIGTMKSVFRKKQNDLGLLEEPALGNSKRAQDKNAIQLDVGDVLEWIDQRKIENDTVRRFVTPCIPPSFTLSTSYEKELHHQFMRLVTRLLHLVHPDGSMVLTESNLIQLTSWYNHYKNEIGEQDEAIDTFLTDSDRKRLITALKRHCMHAISAQVGAVLTTKGSPMSADLKFSPVTGSESDNAGAGVDIDRQGLWRSNLPDVVISCVREQVRSMLSLKIRGLDQAIVEAVEDSLTDFQRQVLEIVHEQRVLLNDAEYGMYLCAVANSMARCLEYTEDMRDLFVQLIPDENRSHVENRMERVIEGFRMTASTTLLALINEISTALHTHAMRFYEPHTGTEIMLDVVATLEDYFSEYEMHLLPFHFEQLAIECLRRVVAWYLAPFLRLSGHKDEDSIARRFTSLPTFDEANVAQERDIIFDYDGDREVSSRRSENDYGGRRVSRGLSTMSAEAVVAQIDKDLSNVTRFMRRKVVLYHKKQLEPTLEPMLAIRSVYECLPTALNMVQTYTEANLVITRALRHPWVSEYGIEGRMSARVAEFIWESRKDVTPVVLLEAITMIRTATDRQESTSPTRMSSADDGQVWGSRRSDGFREHMAVRDVAVMENSASSMLWIPSWTRSRHC